MIGSTHVALATAATVVYCTTTGQPPPPAGWLAMVVGSLAPDIDAGGGTIARPGSLFGRVLPRWLTRLLDSLGLAVSGLVRHVFGHRNAIHWPIWGIIMMLLAHNLGLVWLWWFGWGYVWHIAGDFCTKSGVPILGPILTKDIHWSLLKTGTWPEYVINLALWGVIFYFGWTYVPAEARYWLVKFGSTYKEALWKALQSYWSV